MTTSTTGRRRAQLALAGLLTVTVAAGLLTATPQAVGADNQRLPRLQADKPVDVSPVPAKKGTKKNPAAEASRPAPAPQWPQAGKSEVVVGADGAAGTGPGGISVAAG
ncbi:MAG: hypothetical protein ACRDUA_05040, partial [Micromonosporaceae bacterium]